MTDVTAADLENLKKSSKRPLLIGAVLAVIAGGGAYYAVSEVVAGAPGDENEPAASTHETDHSAQTVAFVPLDPMVVSLQGAQSHLRFSAEIEVEPGTQDDVAALMPRMIDVLNDYLRAVDADQLSGAGALMQLRSQMLHRLQVVVGGDRVRDLLIMEFVLN